VGADTIRILVPRGWPAAELARQGNGTATMNISSLHTPQLHLWLDRLKAGDRAAREELLQNVFHRLERLARKMLGRFPTVRGWADTGDVLQSAVMRLLRALKEVRPGSVRDFFGLAAEQMRRELLDLARRASRERRVRAEQASGLSDEKPPPATDIEVSAEEHDELEQWQRFHETVMDLPAEEREVVSLVYYHGWSQVQVATLFGVNERTIRRCWRAACVRLHELLSGRFPGLEPDDEPGASPTPEGPTDER
jgi:RNA polymerase sigma-70 factor (ECF subfamily)